MNSLLKNLKYYWGRFQKDYVGVYQDGPSTFVYVGKKMFFPHKEPAFLQRVNLHGLNLIDLYIDSKRSGVKFGGLVMYPSVEWERPLAINTGTSVNSLEEVIESCQQYFSKNFNFVAQSIRVEDEQRRDEGDALTGHDWVSKRLSKL